MTDPVSHPPADSVRSPAPTAGGGLISRADFMALTKARLSTLVVVTTFVGFWVGAGWAGMGWTLVHTVFGTTLTAFGAAVFNQLMEVDADAKMHRTADRPLPARRLRSEAAFVLGWLLCAVGIIHLGVLVNVESAALAILTLVVYLFIYTPMKRTSAMNTLVGAVSGALPPVIGWVAAAGGADAASRHSFQWSLLAAPQAVFLFALLFLWQLPHFVAINWMYREEYIRGGFVMWSNDDVSGAKTSRLALLFSVLTAVLSLHPWLAGFASPVFAVVGLLLGGWLVWLSLVFCKTRERSAARRLFFATLLHLPLILLALCLLAKRQ
ncbi:MAG: heme o synthase [Verrucomicrobiales bacterium]|nr:heme o synthase [Verrucomicrobiales bacterium]